jgi:hypothetical protein
VSTKRQLHAVSIFVTGVFLVLAAGSDNTNTPPAPSSSTPDNPAVQAPVSPAVPPPPDSPAVLNDAKALDEKYGIEAALSCSSDADDYLRSIAKFDFKWDDMGFADFKFDKYAKTIVSPGVFTSISNKAKLQNGFGAFEHITLLCDYDTQAKKVVRFRVLEKN